MSHAQEDTENAHVLLIRQCLHATLEKRHCLMLSCDPYLVWLLCQLNERLMGKRGRQENHKSEVFHIFLFNE